MAGRIENWRLGDDGDDLRTSPYFTKHPDSPPFNKLFAALYDLIFSKMTNMGYLIPSPTRTLKEIFKEKIHGTERFLVSAELIAYLKWLIYVGLFKDRTNVEHVIFYNKEVAFLNNPSNARWRGLLYIELEAWYSEFKPAKKRKGRSSGGMTSADAMADGDRELFINIDGFIDPLADDDAPPPASGAALAVAAQRAAAEAAGDS